MPARHCTACGATGHRSDSPSCPKRGQSTICGYCGRNDGTHTEGCKRKGPERKPRGRPVAKPMPHPGGCPKPAKKSAPTVPRDLPTNGPRQTALVLLGPLEALQAKLAARIASVRELSEIL